MDQAHNVPQGFLGIYSPTELPAELKSLLTDFTYLVDDEVVEAQVFQLKTNENQEIMTKHVGSCTALAVWSPTLSFLAHLDSLPGWLALQPTIEQLLSFIKKTEQPVWYLANGFVFDDEYLPAVSQFVRHQANELTDIKCWHIDCGDGLDFSLNVLTGQHQIKMAGLALVIRQ